jgi:hypothetical protein
VSRAAIAGLLLGVACAALACASTRTQGEARAFADGYFELLRQGRLDEALELCEADFFARTPREDWIAARRRVEQRLGTLESFAMAKWTMELLPNGTFVTFEYDVVYSGGTSRDTLTVVDPARRPGFRVYGHHVHSELL